MPAIVAILIRVLIYPVVALISAGLTVVVGAIVKKIKDSKAAKRRANAVSRKDDAGKIL